MKYEQAKGNRIKRTIAMPFILGMVFPLIILHITLEIYHRVAFKMYEIDYVDVKKFIKLDRHKLSKISFAQKIYCYYCGYANGLLPYAVEIAGETEKYWCGIKHDVESCKLYNEPAHHAEFIDYKEFV